jgi:DNA mismatch repair protein MLH1
MAPPKPIRRLAEEVVNRVAAGEVIHRPASALKELLENALDAGATSITVTVKDGGNKLLQIQDDGHGIRAEDLPILCERHTTSKLSSFEDLDTVRTFGFRGEALASVSFVSNLTVTTMTADAPHALKASYRDGALENDQPARPCAGVPGTTITVENLFFNVPTRRRALKSASEEFSKVLDVIQRYAASRVDVAFACRKLGEAKPALHCPVVADRVERIRAVYGATVARELGALKFEIGADEATREGASAEASERGGSGASAEASERGGSGASAEARGDQDDAPARCSVDALVSGASYRSRRATFVLFINDRLVECAPLKRAIEATYAATLPKAERPFAFVALTLPPRTVDVNVHPTKREVRFLRQDDVIEAVRLRVEEALLASNGARTFRAGGAGDPEAGGGSKSFFDAADTNAANAPLAPPPTRATQTRMPGAPDPDGAEYDAEAERRAAKRAKTTTREKVGGDHKLARVDATLADSNSEECQGTLINALRIYSGAKASAENGRHDVAVDAYTEVRPPPRFDRFTPTRIARAPAYL